ncbi:MAG: tyrosine-type recombinase/integrase [Actinomycetota bacterium]
MLADRLRQGDEGLDAAAGGLRAEPLQQQGHIVVAEVPGEDLPERLLEGVRPPEVAWGELWNDTGLVFTRENGNPIDPNWLSKRFNRLVRDAALPLIRFHALRHTWATLSLQAGVELWAVADLAGHSNVSVTDRVYRHAIPSRLRDASDRLSGLLFQDPLVSNPLADR